VLWSARIVAIATCAFLSLFALDAWTPGRPLSQTAAEVAVHLVPSAILLLIILLAWRQPWIGAVGFVALAAAYAVMVRFRLDWLLVVSGPLLTAGLLFLWSWRQSRRVAAR
jgi:hypothetical protein